MINARDAAGFEAGNVAGTAAMLAAAEKAGIKRFVHVSSLAAREPRLSQYGASKARAEELVEARRVVAIVRPPAVYDRGTADARMSDGRARPRSAATDRRLSVIHVDDLARLLLALTDPPCPERLLVEPDDGRKGGWSHTEFGHALGRALGRRVMTLSMPQSILMLGARIDGLVRRDKAKLTADRAAYFCHPDWTVERRGERPKRCGGQKSKRKRACGTARWYREAGWL